MTGIEHEARARLLNMMPVFMVQIAVPNDE